MNERTVRLDSVATGGALIESTAHASSLHLASGYDPAHRAGCRGLRRRRWRWWCFQWRRPTSTAPTTAGAAGVLDGHCSPGDGANAFQRQLSRRAGGGDDLYATPRSSRISPSTRPTRITSSPRGSRTGCLTAVHADWRPPFRSTAARPGVVRRRRRSRSARATHMPGRPTPGLPSAIPRSCRSASPSAARRRRPARAVRCW